MVDPEHLAQLTREQLDSFSKDSTEYDGLTGPLAIEHARVMSILLERWLENYKGVTTGGRHAQPQKHTPGRCLACGMHHSMARARELNGEPHYLDMIRRSDTGPDPLVKEPGP